MNKIKYNLTALSTNQAVTDEAKFLLSVFLQLKIFINHVIKHRYTKFAKQSVYIKKLGS